MVVIHANFNAHAFNNKFSLTSDDWYVRGETGEIICSSLPDLADADIADCVVDIEMQARVQVHKETAKAQAKNIPGWAAWDEAQAVSYVMDNVTDLASAKTVLVTMAKMLVALRDETWPDLTEV